MVCAIQASPLLLILWKVSEANMKAGTETGSLMNHLYMSESQSYEYEPDPNGSIRVFRLTKKGWRETGGGNGLLIGSRKTYHDYSF